jgi:PAS domain S-box-containing protein
MVIADPNGAFLKINPSCTEILGYSDTELLARPFIDFVHPDDKQSTLDEMARQQQIGSSMNFENRYLCKDGSLRWLSWRAMFDKKEGITFATARDMTARKLAEEEREHLISELQKMIAEVKVLQGIIPICSVCKKVRDDAGSWSQMEAYISNHSEAEFSHGYCPECTKKAMEEFKQLKARNSGKQE